MTFFQSLFYYQISFSLLIKKQLVIIFLPPKQRIYDCFYEFASEALHIVIFENFVKSMTSCLSKLKVTPKFCIPFQNLWRPDRIYWLATSVKDRSVKRVTAEIRKGVDANSTLSSQVVSDWTRTGAFSVILPLAKVRVKTESPIDIMIGLYCNVTRNS